MEDMHSLTVAIDSLEARVTSVSRRLEEIRDGIHQLDRNLTQIIASTSSTPTRRVIEGVAGRWNELRLRHMPTPPVGSFVRTLRLPPPKHCTPMYVIDKYTGKKFELLIVKHLKDAGWPTVEHVGGAGDFGVDIIARSDATVMAVQAKRYKARASVTSADMQKFLGGATHHYNATSLLLVTTSEKLTPDAAALASKANVTICTRPAVAAWMERGIVPAGVRAPSWRSTDERRAMEEQARNTPPPEPQPRQIVTFAVLLGSVTAAGLAATYPQTHTYGIAIAVTGLGAAFVNWLEYRWRLHGWNVGMALYWPEAVNEK